jgi:hypothetical protein
MHLPSEKGDLQTVRSLIAEAAGGSGDCGIGVRGRRRPDEVMVVVQVHRVDCSKCEAEVPLYVYRPKAQLLLTGIGHGFFDELADEVLSKALIKAQEIDAEEQANGEVEDTARLVQESGGVFVDGRKLQAVCCPHCGALLLVVCKEAYG